MGDYDHSRVEPGDPEQCQQITRHGQCRNKKMPGILYCPGHAGGMIGNQKKQELKNYQLGKYQTRVQDMVNSPEIKSLREEVGIARMVLEGVLLRCTGDNDLLLHSNKISDLVTKIEKLVLSCHKLEQSNGFLLDKATVIKLAEGIVDVIGLYIKDEEAVEKVANGILDLIYDTKNAVE